MRQLNKEQQNAVNSLHGPILVSAGAGSGKTFVLTSRVKKLVEEHKIPIGRILIVTFTNRAATEIKSRLLQVTDISNSWIGTFHSLCMKMLRADGHLIDCGPDIKVADKNEQKKLLKQLSIPKIFQLNDVLEAIDSYKNAGIIIRSPEIRSLYCQYENLKKSQKFMDYTDLLLYANQLLEKHPDIAKKYQELFDFICVDEYQDTNTIQSTWLQKITNERKNIFCVGDEDQSIFEWRGSDPRLMRDFNSSFTKASYIKLETNYRSTSNILSAANHLIQHNSDRMPKVLRANKEQGNPVCIFELIDDTQEAKYVISKLRELEGTSAILCRTSGQMRAFEDCFRSSGINYEVIGGVSFYERNEVKDVIGYARFLNDTNNIEYFSRIVNVPRRGVSAKALQQIGNGSALYGLESTARQYPELQSLFAAVDLAKAKYKENANTNEALSLLLNASGYMELRNADPSADSAQRKDNVQALLDQSSAYNSLESFCANIEMNVSFGTGNILLMTIHSAKGLEFDNVALPGWEDGLMPHIMSINEGKLDEERRLAYVAITRARTNLFITCARHRYRPGQLKATKTASSRFLNELPLSVKWVHIKHQES